MGFQRVEVEVLPDCDVCRENGEQRAAFADCKTMLGPWAYVCRDHYMALGCSLGAGRGQELIPVTREVPELEVS